MEQDEQLGGLEPPDWNEEVVVTTRPIQDQISEFYDLGFFKPAGLRCNKGVIFHEFDEELPELANLVDVEKFGDDYVWRMDQPAGFEDRMSRTTLSTSMTRKMINRLRHEFVAEAIGMGNTDKKLIEVFPSVDDGMDHLTPDFLEVDMSGIYHCIEIATTRATDMKQIDKIINDKIFKYENALFMRSRDKVITYTVILANQHGIYSNVNLDKFLTDDMYIRYRLTITLENIGKEKGFDIFNDREDERLNQIALDIQEQIKEIEVDESVPDDGLLISKEFIAKCVGSVDQNKVLEAYQTSIAKTVMPTRQYKPSIQEIDLRLKGIRETVEKYKKEYDSDELRRTNRVKPVVNLPNIIPKRSIPSTRVHKMSVGKSKNTEHEELIQLWSSAFSQVDGSSKWKELPEKDLLSEARETRKEKLEDHEKVRKLRMVERGRVNISCKKDGKLHKYLARDGIKGKSTKNDQWRKQRKSEQSKTLKYSTDTDDITGFITSMDLFEVSQENNLDFMSNHFKLIGEANDIAGNPSKGLDLIKDLYSRKIMDFASFISELASELTLSLSQFVKSNDMILKKLRNYNCYLLLSPAGKRNPIGWSLLIPKSTGPTEMKYFIGRSLVETEYAFISPFTTTMPDKLENMWNLPSTIISMISFLMYFYNKDSSSVDELVITPGLTEQFLLLLAIRLEDKAETEETVTQTRYMYMEIMKTSAVLMKPDPLKILSKMNTAPRSRLNLFLQKRIVESFLIMLTDLPVRAKENDFEVEEDGGEPLPTDNWIGLINYMDCRPVSSATKCLSMFYVGYLKNKNAVAQGNVNWLLLEKTITEEMKIDWSNRAGYSGEQPTTEIPSSHQFNTECIKAGSESLEKKLAGNYGPDWKDSIGRKVLNALSLLNSYKLSSLKASSTTKDEEVTKDVTKMNNKPVRRRKVLEAVADNVKLFGINPFRKLRTFVCKRLSGSKKARSDLFKKQQHGGLREIYVLDEVTRVLQLFIETCSRTICQEFEEESLTNPKRKLPIINQHFKKAKRYATASDRYSINYNCSLDKTRWNQGFMIRALAVCLFRMMPVDFHGAIQKILNMWIGKDIKIPPEVCDLLLKDIRLNSNAYERLRQEFFGIKKFEANERPITRGPKKAFISLQSGFMQGILHYTSSLVHLAYLSVTKRLLTRTIGNLGQGISSLISFACSSDDSAILVTMFFPKGSEFFSKELVSMSDNLERILHSLEHFCKFFCMRPSVKSTVAMMDSVEFNSEFIFNNTLAIPTLKFVIAAVNIIPYESFMDKLDGCYNLLSSLLSSGFPAYNTHLCQMAQAIMHYQSLGINLSPLGNQISDMIGEIRDPNYGFFPMDNHRCPGLMGLPFCLYLTYKRTGILPISPKHLKKDPIVSLEGGVPSESLQISHGDRRKQKKLLLSLKQVSEGRTMQLPRPSDVNKFNELLNNVQKAAMDKVNQEYDLFYRAAESEEELITKLMFKVLMPGVSKSLNSGNAFIQTVAASLYSGHTPCVQVSTERYEPVQITSKNVKPGQFRKTTTKVSLFAALNLRKKELSRLEDEDLNCKDLESICFPLIKKYEEARNIIHSFDNSIEMTVPRFRCQKNKIDIIPSGTRLPLGLLQTVKILWFGHKNPTSGSVFHRCLEIHRQSYPWIMESHDESLLVSPFNTPLEMYSFINSMSDGYRSLVLNCPSLSSSGFSSQLTWLIKKNYKQCVILRRPAEDHKRRMKWQTLKDRLSLALFMVNGKEIEGKIKSILTGLEVDDIDISGMLEMSKADITLQFLKLFYNEKKSHVLAKLNEFLNSNRAAYFLVYTKEQRSKQGESGKTIWFGEGEAILKIGNDTLVIQLMDEEIIEIRTPTLQTVTRNLNTLKTVCADMGVLPRLVRARTSGTCAKYNADKLVSIDNPGCPVKLDNTIESKHLEVKDIRVKVYRGIIMMQYKTIGHRWITVFKFKARREGIDTSSQGPAKNEFWDAWIGVSPWSVHSAMGTMKAAKETLDTIEAMSKNWRIRMSEDKKERQSEIKQDTTELKQFWATTLRARLSYVKAQRTFVDNCLSSLGDINEFPEEDELEDDFFLNLNNELDLGADDLYEGIVSQIKEEQASAIPECDTDELYNSEDLLAHIAGSSDSEIKKLSDLISPALEGTPLTNILDKKIAIEHYMQHVGLIGKPQGVTLTHPLWDDVIRTFDISVPGFFTKLMEGVISSSALEDSRLFLWLFDIKEKNIITRVRDPNKEKVDLSIKKAHDYVLSLAGEMDSSEDES